VPQSFWRRGTALVPEFLSAQECERVLGSIDDYRRSHDVPLIHRPASGRSLRYHVIDGDRVPEAVPQLPELCRRVDRELGRLCERPLTLIDDATAAININITPPGGEYRWHYDRNAVTTLLYLNEVPGGETELYPNYRLHIGLPRHSRAQQGLDWLLRLPPVRRGFGRLTVVAPRRGTLVVMRGNCTLHSVRSVGGVHDRINLVMAYDLPGAARPNAGLNQYLYSPETHARSDPNYTG
jgi:hypothetical protein